MIGFKWLPLKGYTLPIFDADQFNGLKIFVLNRITKNQAYCPESEASTPPPAESSPRGKKIKIKK